jgi:DNA-binding GntR family transcriptional regulator
VTVEPQPISETPVYPDVEEPGSSVDLSLRVERVAAPLREQVLDLLRREIVELRLRPGQRLVERELIERLGVSRTTVREALRQLAAEGLVKTIPQRGAVVAVHSAREAAEVYEVRALLEAAAAKQFVENASDAQVLELRQAFDALESSQRETAETPQVFLQAKNMFYDVLFAGAANETVRSILEGLQARIALLRATTLTAPGRLEQSLVEIRAIVKAVEQRDGDAAAEAAAHHVRQAARTAQALFIQETERREASGEGETDV